MGTGKFLIETNGQCEGVRECVVAMPTLCSLLKRVLVISGYDHPYHKGITPSHIWWSDVILKNQTLKFLNEIAKPPGHLDRDYGLLFIRGSHLRNFCNLISLALNAYWIKLMNAFNFNHNICIFQVMWRFVVPAWLKPHIFKKKRPPKRTVLQKN